MKKILIAAFLFAFPVLLFAQGFEIRGKVPGLKNGTASILIRNASGEEVNLPGLQPVKIVDGAFILKGEVERPKLLKVKVSTKVFSVMIENTVYTIDTPFADLSAASIKGGPMNEEYQKIMAAGISPLEWLWKNTNTPLAGYFAHFYFSSEPSSLDTVLNKLGPKALNTWNGKELQKIHKGFKALHGKSAPAIDMKTADNKTFSLTQLKGKIVVVDFWASWCGPCRKFIPELKRIYGEYASKGVAFLSVSLDKNHSDWTTALQEETMPWLQTIADKAFEKEGVRKDYYFNSIPYMVIIGADGTIISQIDFFKKEKLEAELKKFTGNTR